MAICDRCSGFMQIDRRLNPPASVCVNCGREVGLGLLTPEQARAEVEQRGKRPRVRAW